MTDFANDSVTLVPADGDKSGRDQKLEEKRLIYCPAISSDTLLLFITQHESYSLRCYSGWRGVSSQPKHVEGIHKASEFKAAFSPTIVDDVKWLEQNVGLTTKWQRTVGNYWSDFQKKRGIA